MGNLRRKVFDFDQPDIEHSLDNIMLKPITLHTKILKPKFREKTDEVYGITEHPAKV